MKLGLFGGSFDPVHLGHLLVAQAAVEELGLDRLFFIPAGQSPFKLQSPPSPAAVRLQLLRLALAGRTHYELDAQEIQRGGISYAVETLRDYARRFPGAELFYLIGADNAAALSRWREASELATLAEFVAVPRPHTHGFPSRSVLLARSRAGEGGPASRPPGAAVRGRRHPRRTALRLKRAAREGDEKTILKPGLLFPLPPRRYCEGRLFGNLSVSIRVHLWFNPPRNYGFKKIG